MFFGPQKSSDLELSVLELPVLELIYEEVDKLQPESRDPLFAEKSGFCLRRRSARNRGSIS